DEAYLEYNPNANVDDGSCLTLIVEGCMDPDAENYNPNANVDDGSCDYFCQTGEVEIVLTITQQNNTGAFWSLTANSTNQLASQSGNILLYSGDKIHRFCVDQGTPMHFSSTSLFGFAITQCGAPVDPSSTNPEEAFFIADCSFDLDEEVEFQDVYPNPSSGYIQGTSDELWSTIRFFNTLGQEVKRYTPTQNNWKTNVSDLPNGLYTLQFDSETTHGIARLIVRK
ncbi:MAG: T9SS type A sorting domain-containing protein, partial [Flavobacteriales bacterium]